MKPATAPRRRSAAAGGGRRPDPRTPPLHRPAHLHGPARAGDRGAARRSRRCAGFRRRLLCRVAFAAVGFCARREKAKVLEAGASSRFSANRLAVAPVSRRVKRSAAGSEPLYLLINGDQHRLTSQISPQTHQPGDRGVTLVQLITLSEGRGQGVYADRVNIPRSHHDFPDRWLPTEVQPV